MDDEIVKLYIKADRTLIFKTQQSAKEATNQKKNLFNHWAIVTYQTDSMPVTNEIMFACFGSVAHLYSTNHYVSCCINCLLTDLLVHLLKLM